MRIAACSRERTWRSETCDEMRSQVAGLLMARSVGDGESFDLDQEVRMRELADLHRGARRQRRAEVPHPHVDVLEVLLDVGDVRRGLHDVLEPRARGLERRLDVLAH